MNQKRRGGEVPGRKHAWQEAQRNYWDAWQQLSVLAPASPGGLPTGVGAWNEVLDRWWGSVAGALPPKTRAPFEQLVEQGKAFFRMAEHFKRDDSSAQSETEAGVFGSELFKRLKQASTGPGAGMDAVLPVWGQQLEAWNKGLARMNLGEISASGTAFPQPLQSAVPDGMYAATSHVLFGPGGGLLQAPQIQEGAQRLLDYQRALARYLGIFQSIAVEALERLRERVQSAEAGDKKLESTRQFYDLWVDCSEEVYLECAASDEYAEVFAGLINALVALKAHAQQTADQVARSAGLPSRAEVDSVYAELHSLRRELRQPRAAASGAETVKASARPGKPSGTCGAAGENEKTDREKNEETERQKNQETDR